MSSVANQKQVLNTKKAIESLADEDLFNDIAKQFDGSCLQPQLQKLRTGMEGFDYATIRLAAHTLKGTALYLGAERLADSARLLQESVDLKDSHAVYANYPNVITESIKAKREIRHYLSKGSGMRLSAYSRHDRIRGAEHRGRFQGTNMQVLQFGQVRGRRVQCQDGRDSLAPAGSVAHNCREDQGAGNALARYRAQRGAGKRGHPTAGPAV